MCTCVCVCSRKAWLWMTYYEHFTVYCFCFFFGLLLLCFSQFSFPTKENTSKPLQELQFCLSPGFIPFLCCFFHFGNITVMAERASKHSVLLLVFTQQCQEDHSGLKLREEETDDKEGMALYDPVLCCDVERYQNNL